MNHKQNAIRELAELLKRINDQEFDLDIDFKSQKTKAINRTSKKLTKAIIEQKLENIIEHIIQETLLRMKT